MTSTVTTRSVAGLFATGLHMDHPSVTTHIFDRPHKTFTIRAIRFMRASTVEAFHETMSHCFESVVQDMLGEAVKHEIFRLLARNGIQSSDVSLRFDDVVAVLTQAFGASARVIVYKTVVELHREYSLRADFTYKDSMRDRISLLKEKVVAELIKPRHLLSVDSYYVPSPRVEPSRVT